MLRKLSLLALVALAGGSTAVARASGTGLVSPQPVSSPPALTPPKPAVLPPALLALEQKMGTLQLSSERFSLKTAITGVKLPKGLDKLLNLDSTISGEVSTSPPAGMLTLSLFGQPLTLRLVGETTYLYEPALSSHDGGRPWIKLGHHPLAELLHSSSGTGVEAGPPASGPPFAGVVKLINGAGEVQEGATSVVDGQAVTEFTAVFDPSKLEKPARTITIKTAHGHRVLRPPKLKQTGRLEVFIAPSGLPVRTVVAVKTGKATDTATVDVLAINFPLIIEAPPANQTIDLAQLKKLEKGPVKKRGKGKRK